MNCEHCAGIGSLEMSDEMPMMECNSCNGTGDEGTLMTFLSRAAKRSPGAGIKVSDKEIQAIVAALTPEESVDQRHLQLPGEIETQLRWATGGWVPPQVHYALKNEKSRNTAWKEIRPSGRDNPWRRAHTENYWVWYS